MNPVGSTRQRSLHTCSKNECMLHMIAPTMRKGRRRAVLVCYCQFRSCRVMAGNDTKRVKYDKNNDCRNLGRSLVLKVCLTSGAYPLSPVRLPPAAGLPLVAYAIACSFHCYCCCSSCCHQRHCCRHSLFSTLTLLKLTLAPQIPSSKSPPKEWAF